MIKFLIKTLVFVSFICFFNSSQAQEIKIRFIGNCGLHMTDGQSNIYIDFPYKSGAHKYMEYNKAEIDSIRENSVFIFTHRHADHYSKKILKKLQGKKIDPSNIFELRSLSDLVTNFNITAFKTEHKVYGIPFKHYSYLITWHDKKIYFAGDTGDLEEISKLKDIDWAFVNPWLYMNAQNKEISIDAKNFGMYHLYPDQKIYGKIPSNLLILNKQGEIIKIPY